MIYFTSDLHLGHERAIELCFRPFSSAEEMNRMLIENINQTVAPDDELWVLGDFAHRIHQEQVRELRRQILCRHVHLVKGNHDKNYAGNHIFQSVQDYKELKTPYGKFILFHYPIHEWNAMHYGSVHLHGHIHSRGAHNAENLKRKIGCRFFDGSKPDDSSIPLRIYDVGVDANFYKPVSIEEIADLMHLKKNDAVL